MIERPALRALAARVGIERHYESALDRRQVEVPDSTLESLLDALGYDVADEAAARRSQEGLGHAGGAATGAGRLSGAVDPARPASRAFGVEEALGTTRGFGIQVNVYALRGGLGHGDIGDLHGVARWTADHGGAFVAVNPMHAATHIEGDDSPYMPLDRLHLDPIYIDLERVPELEGAPLARELLASPEAVALWRTDEIDRPRVWRLKRRILEALFEGFVEGRAEASIDRGRDFEAFRAARGAALIDFATFCAIAEHFEAHGDPSIEAWDWRTWPIDLQAPDTLEVERFREAHAEVIDFHAWMQWEVSHQLAQLDRDAHAMGLSLGLCGDLPLGSRPGGVETWRWSDLFVLGVEVGAPPDDYARDGQTWGFPPIDPARLIDAEGQRAFEALVSAAMAHAGALRIDHAMCMNRLFWIPEGAPPSEGAYVRYPEQRMLDTLVRASQHDRCVVVGEDLGTLPEGFSERIRERGLLSTRVLYFERDGEEHRAAEHYPAPAYVAANTHDLPPLAGWFDGDDLTLRRSVGQFARESEWQAALDARTGDRARLAERLRKSGHLASDEPLTSDGLLRASTRFLAETPCALVALSLDDLAGERIPINLPGVPQAVHRSWVRRSSLTLDGIARRPAARDALESMRASRGRP